MIEQSDHPVMVEPAQVAAIARCVIARRGQFAGPEVRAIIARVADAGHPRRCEWEDYPLEELLRYLREFNAWAFDGTGNIRRLDEDGQPRADIKPLLDFQALPRREQRRLRYLAQYGEEPSPDGSARAGTSA